MKRINKVLLEAYNDRKQIAIWSLLFIVSYITGDIVPSNPHVIQASTLWVGVGSAVLSVGASIWSSNKASESAANANALAAENNRMQNEIARENLKDQRLQTARLEEQKEVYRNIEFSNPYENIQTDFENVYEDLTVNQQQANFQNQMFQQSQANTMQGLRGAAGSSGIAGLAQVLANQGQQAAQQASASIGQQESANQRAAAGGAANVQQMEYNAKLKKMDGESSLEEREMNRQSTLLGMQMGQLSGANSAVMQSQQNQMAANASQANLYGQQSAAQYGMAGQMLSSGISALGNIEQ